jgi:hypothetical protein
MSLSEPAYLTETSRGFADPPTHGCGQQYPSYIARSDTHHECTPTDYSNRMLGKDAEQGMYTLAVC